MFDGIQHAVGIAHIDQEHAQIENALAEYEPTYQAAL
jgi:hypothetical protein